MERIKHELVLYIIGILRLLIKIRYLVYFNLNTVLKKHRRDNIMKRLYRSSTEKIICGVCGGLAEYLGIDSVLVRLAAIALFIVNPGAAIILYIAACIIMPEKPTIPGTTEEPRYEAKQLIENLRQSLAEGARGLGIFIGVILVLLGTVIVLSNIWPTLADVLKYTWDILVGFNKIIAGLLLLAIGLVTIIISEKRRR